MSDGIIWPAFLPNQILVGNPKSNVAIVCGWTRRELMRDKLAAIDPKIMEKIAGIGQLYTAGRGVDVMVRNLLANPRINTVIFGGKDTSGASKEAYAFMISPEPLITKSTSSGQKYVTIESMDQVRIWGDIPIDAIKRVRMGTNWIMPEVVYPSGAPTPDAGLVWAVDRYRDMHRTPMDAPEIHPMPKPSVSLFPSPNSAQILRVKTVADGWLELLHYIMTFGKRVSTHYDQDTLEIMDLVMVITDQNPVITEKDLPPYMPFMFEHVQQYIEGLMSGEKKSDLTYTYGNLIRAHFGVDQLDSVALKLAKDNDSRSAVISLWDPRSPSKGSPCLNHIWFRILNGKLNMTATIRSNDMFQGWPENAYGLRSMQNVVRGMIIAQMGGVADNHQIELGDLVIISQSAHIYEDCWSTAQTIVDEHRKYKEWWDEKGHWIIAPDADANCVTATLTQGGEILYQTSGSTTQIRRAIAKKGLISDIGHALYIGAELERAAEMGRLRRYGRKDE